MSQQYANLELQPDVVRVAYNEYVSTHQTLAPDMEQMSFEGWAAMKEEEYNGEEGNDGIGGRIVPAITLEDIIAKLDDKYSLVYVDRGDDLDNRMEEIQKVIHEGCHSHLDEVIDGWYDDNKYDTCMEIIKNIQKEMEEEYGLEEDDLDEIFEEHRDEVRYAIEERDDSNPLKDLIQATSDPVMFYDLNVDMEGYGGEVDEEVAKIKEALSIPADDTRFDKKLAGMVADASYGGRLVVYFNGDLSDWLDPKTVYADPTPNTITFSGRISLAIIDTMQGSGGDTEIEHTFSVPYDRENVFLDKTIKYSYTYEVCGMSRDWCDGTVVQLRTVEGAPDAEKSSLNDALAREEEYKAKFKAGGCTLGDMDMKRHRGVMYINSFPCGNICPSCGTFWID